jgi:hypothetical protein
MLWFYLGASISLAALGGLYWRWRKRVRAEIAEGAAVEWARYQQSDPALLAGLDEARFAALYGRVHFPRFPAYALACLAAFLLSLPLSFGVLAAGSYAAERLGLAPQSADIADRYLVEDGAMRVVRAAPPEAAAYWVEDIGGFYYLFGVLIAWLLIVAIVMRRYHARRPGTLRDEILRAR